MLNVLELIIHQAREQQKGKDWPMCMYTFICKILIKPVENISIERKNNLLKQKYLQFFLIIFEIVYCNWNIIKMVSICDSEIA